MYYKTARRLVIGVIGATVLIMSIIGYILPLIPGIPLTIMGLAILGTEVIWARRLLKTVRATAEDLFDRARGKNRRGKPPKSSDELGQKGV